MALMSSALLVTRTADGTGFDAVGFVAVAGAGSVVAPDWKYEHAGTASNTSRICERIV
jgi:hypothetical protein